MRTTTTLRPRSLRPSLTARPARAAPRPARAAASDDVPAPTLALAATSLPASGILLWSAYTKATTGEGLQGDLLGGLEGVSYLIVPALIALSIKTKVDTGSGLPAGPGGLVGAAEGIAYLALTAGIGSIAYAALAK